MALFESGPRKTLKKLRKFASEGSVNKVSSTVREEKGLLLEESDVALELLELLLEIGHPNLAASIGEEVMRRHRQVSGEVRSLLIGRLNEFSRSVELLRVIWRSSLDIHDFRGALDVLRHADDITVSGLVDIIREKMQSSMRFDGSVHPEADQASLVEWALYLHREHRSGESINFLWKVCREVDFPHRDIPLLAFWIGNQVKDLDSSFLIPLAGIAAVSGNMDRALQFAGTLAESKPDPDEATDAAAVIEKYMLPSDHSGRSAAILAEMYTCAGKTEAASKTLERIYENSLDRDELESAIEDLVSHPEAGAAPLLLSAQMNLEKGRTGEAVEAVEKAFEAGDAETGRMTEVCDAVIEKTGDRTGGLAVSLAGFLVERGEIRDAVLRLAPIVRTDPSWVLEQVQKLLSRESNNAYVLSLLAAVLFETGKSGEASATLEHLGRRKDRKFCGQAAEVLERLESQIERYPALREARAVFRLRSDMEHEAAEDWFKYMLTGRTPVDEGRQLLARSDIHAGTVAGLLESGFSPSTPWQAFIAALVCLREDDAGQANGYLGMAMEDPALQMDIVQRIEALPDEQRDLLDLRNILTKVFEGEAASRTASILEKVSGDEDWKVALATSLKWGNPGEEAQFRFRYLLSRNHIILAGTSFVEGSIGEPLIENVAKACSETVADRFAEAIELLEKPVGRPWSSSMARRVLEYILPRFPAGGTRIRKLIAVSYRTEKRFEDVSRILDPILEDEGVMELLEETVEDNPGEYSLVSLLTRTAVMRSDFEKFRRHSAVMLELNPEAAGELVEQAVSLASGLSSGEACLYAARIADRYRVDTDLVALLSRALQLDPGLARTGLGKEFGRVSPAVGALCAVAAGDAQAFINACTENPALRIPVNEAIALKAMEAWEPGRDDEALLLLAGKAGPEGLQPEVEELLRGVAVRGADPWRTRASRMLLDETIEGRVDRLVFWNSVTDGNVIAEALDRLLPDDYSDLSDEEARAVAPAVLGSGQGIRRLFQLADDSVLFPQNDRELRTSLAEECMRCLSEMPADDELSNAENRKLLEILLSAGMIGEAVDIARKTGSDEALEMLSVELARMRKEAGRDGVRGAIDMIITGKPAEALELLEEMDDDTPGALDARALALWHMGMRQQATLTWMGEYRLTGELLPLQRLLWALDQSGASLERTALRRFMTSRYPGTAGRTAAAVRDADPNRIETISGLLTTAMKEKGKT